MTDLNDVLHRATDDLAPEAPDLLLAGALREGSALRRRRRVARGSVVGGVAAACLAVAVVAAGPFAGSTAPRPAGPSRTFASDPTPPTRPPTRPPSQPRVTVARGDFGETFARILPGAVTDEHDQPAGRVVERGAYASTFDWDGYRVSLMVAPYDGDARATCRAATDTRGDGQGCVRVRGGWAVHDEAMQDQAFNRWLNVYRDNGFSMWVLIYNSGGEKGDPSAGPPPLDVPDLERVATSDLWFS